MSGITSALAMHAAMSASPDTPSATSAATHKDLTDAQAVQDGRAWPHRPYVPLAMSALVGLLVAQNVVLRGYMDPWNPVVMVILAGITLVSLACARLIRRARTNVSASSARVPVVPGLLSISVVALTALAGYMGGSATYGQVLHRGEALAGVPVSSLELRIVSDPVPSGTGWFCEVEITGISKDSDSSQAGQQEPALSVVGASVWLTMPERPTYGATVRGVGRFEPNGQDEWGTSSTSRGICGSIRIRRLTCSEKPVGVMGMLSDLRAWALGQINPESGPAAALMAGVIVADRSQLKLQGVEDAFAVAGLSHLVAVSGSHLVVVGSGLEAALLAMGAGPVVRASGVLALSGLYVLFCAAPSSAVRSWVMLAALLVGKVLGRRGHSCSGVALTGIAMCLLDPTAACDLGLMLSILSVAGLSLFGSYAKAALAACVPKVNLRYLPRPVRGPVLRLMRCGDAMLETLSASLVCQLATMPACASSFGTVSLVAPLANVVVGPLFGPVVSLGVFGCAIAWVPLVGNLPLVLCRLLCSLAVALTKVLSALPMASLPVEAPAFIELMPVVLALALLVLWPCPKGRHLRGAVVLVGLALPAGYCCAALLAPAQVVVLDVGQGDAILIREGLHCLLVDTGPDASVSAAMLRNTTLRLNGIVVSHLHDDHYGGLSSMAVPLGVGEVFTAEGSSPGLSELVRAGETNLPSQRVSELRAGDVLHVGRFRIECLWPTSAVSGAENEHSLCLLVEYETPQVSFRMLLTGDAEQDVLEEIADRVGDIDVLKVGHHGSKVSISAQQASTLSPEVSVASAGKGNRYGHPTRVCREVLESAGSVFLCTKDAGDVHLYPNAHGVRYVTQRHEGP